MILDVQLYADRTREGRLTVIPAAGAPESYRCLGRSDSTAAIAHGNPSRDPLKPFGDIPTGSFNAVRTVPAANTPEDLRSYGPGPRFVLNGIDGAALMALHNGRFGLLIHGGATGAPMPPNALRPTHGCIRVDDATAHVIDNALRAANQTSCEAHVRTVSIIETPAAAAARYATIPKPAIAT